MNLSFFLEPPDLTHRAQLMIEALVPLSMTAEQPGTYYRSQRAPTEAMLYGMIENALGWHIAAADRSKLLKKLRDKAKKQFKRGDPALTSEWLSGGPAKSEVGFMSLLQYHLRFTPPHFFPATIHFDDLWARHVHSNGTDAPGGSRNNDYRLERIFAMPDVSFGDRADFDIRDPEELAHVKPGAKVHIKAIRPMLPHFHVSPTPREYVIPSQPYRFRLECTETVANLVKTALDDPASPLYLGTNDGWVEARWEDLP
jgi:CRISPR-associated protein Cas5